MAELYDVSGTYGSTLNVTSTPTGTNTWYDAYSQTLLTKDHSIKGDMLVVEMTEQDLFPLTSSTS